MPRDLAQAAADKLTRLADDMRYAATLPPHLGIPRTLAQSRQDAAKALEALADALPADEAVDASYQANAISRGEGEPTRWATHWRAYAGTVHL